MVHERFKWFVAGYLLMTLALMFGGIAAATYYTGTDQIISRVAHGTAPFVLNSRNLVTNLSVGAVGRVDMDDIGNYTCRPLSPAGSTSGTSYVSIYNCTGCSGYITGLSYLATVNSVELNVSIDGRSKVLTTTTHKMYHNQMRFTDRLNLSVRRSGGVSGTAYAMAWMCLETPQASRAKACYPYDAENYSWGSGSPKTVDSCTNCSGYLRLVWLEGDVANGYMGYVDIMTDGQTERMWSDGSGGTLGPVQFFMNNRFNTKFSVIVGCDTGASGTCTSTIRYCKE